MTTHSSLVVLDYDGTIADTFQPSPEGMNVARAYELAIRDVFGPEIYLIEYIKENGVVSVEPGEIVEILYRFAPLAHIDVSRFGTREEATKRLVEAKLSYLMPEISEIWPQFYPGVWDFFHAVDNGEIPISVAIVSSGHDSFIRKSFEQQGLTPPSNLVTSDALREHSQTTREKYKPNPYQLALAHRTWLKDLRPGTDSVFDGDYRKPSMLYIGDHPQKDGELARRGRIPFGFVPFTHPNFSPSPDLGQFPIDDFGQFTKELLDRRAMLQDGKPFSEILFNVPHEELFPPLHESERPYALWLEQTRAGGRKERFL